MTISTCCNAPCTYQGNRLIFRRRHREPDLVDIYTCDGCGKETETEDIETAEDRAELRGEYRLECERNGDANAE